MRLTAIGRAASIVLATGVGLSLAWLISGDLVPLFARSDVQSALEVRATKRSLVYRLDPARPLTFALSRPSTEFRIVSQPLVDAASWSSRDYWTYGYKVRMFGGDGASIGEQEIWSRALHPDRILPFRRPIRFMRDTDARIALQDDVVVEGDKPISRVELVPLQSDTSVVAIDLRLYERLPFFGRAAVAAFRRRPPVEQAEMAGASALPPELLSDSARAALITNRWRVLGPLGIPGDDYTVSVLYEGRYNDQPDGEEE